MRYFDHDTTAGSDDKILALRLEHGSGAIDAYWTLLEKMYADEKPLKLVGSNLETKSVLHRLNIGFDTLKSYVASMLVLGLFQGTMENLYSERAMANIEEYQRKCETARQNGKKGGRKPKAETNGKPSRFPSGNQDAKLRKEKKGMGFDKQNPYRTAGADAALEGAAPPIGYDPKRIPSQGQIEQQRAEAERMEADAIPCPDEVMAQVMAATGGAK